MEISRETHDELLALIERITGTDAVPAEDVADIATVRAAVRPAGDHIEFDAGETAVHALAGLMLRRRSFPGLRTLLLTLRPDGSPRPNHAAWVLYQNSPLLQGIGDEDLETPRRLADRLFTLRPAIIEEQHRLQGANDGPPPHYALATLTAALIAGGRIIRRATSFIWNIGTRDLYERSRILKEEVRDADLASPDALIARLIALRPRLVEEQRRAQAGTGRTPNRYALATFVKALAMGGRIAEGDEQTFVRSAGELELYNRSPILQHEITADDLASPAALTDKLLSLKERIVREQQLALGVGPKDLSDYTLGMLIRALRAGGRLPPRSHRYEWWANGRELFDASPLLQHGIGAADLALPQALLARLMALRPAIAQEQRRRNGSADDAPPRYALGTLVEALMAGGRLDPSAQIYSWVANTRELYDRSEILQRQVDPQDLKSPALLIARLVLLRPAIIEEQRRVRGVDEEELEGYALGTLVLALEAAGRIPGNSQPYTRRASAWDLYQRSEILRKRVRPSDLVDPAALVRRLIALRPAIVAEQRALRGPAARIDEYSLGTLVEALAVAGRISGNTVNFERTASARETYDRSPTLREIGAAGLFGDADLMEQLLARRDRIAAENLAALGMLSPTEVPGLGREGHYALATLTLALYAGGVLRNWGEQNRIISSVAGPLEYVVRRWDAISPEIERLAALGVRDGIVHEADRSLFTRLDDPSRELRSDKYVRNIIRWGIWFLNHPDLPLRSIFGGDEILAMVRSQHGGLLASAPASIVHQMESGAVMVFADPIGSRREAVSALVDLLDHYDGFARAGIELDAETLSELDELRRLADWNRDALGDGRTSPDGDPSPHRGGPPERGRGQGREPPAFGGVVTIENGPSPATAPASCDGDAPAPFDALSLTPDAASLVPAIVPLAAGRPAALSTR